MDVRSWLSAPRQDRAIWFADESDGWFRHSYAEVADGARRTATLLREFGFESGDGACVVLPTGPDAAAAFFGAWAAGGWFTPIAPPLFDDLEAYRDHLAALLRAAEPRVVVTEPDFAPLVAAAMRGAGRADAPLVLTADLLDRTAPIAVVPDAGPVCLVQFTSGSTGTPRGVRVGWSNLADNIARITRVIDWREGDATASWLPLFHDMGLVGALLMTAVQQGDLYLMRPDQFVRDPVRWLRAMTRAQHSPAPAFALDYVTRRAAPDQVRALDLSGWRTLVLGAEPVPPAAVVAFARHLQPAGFRLDAVTVAYGLAESTLFASSSARYPVAVRVDPAELAQGSHVGVLERRELALDTDLAGSGWLTGVGSDPCVTVIDDDGVPVPDGVLGELRVTGGSVALGYVGADSTGTSISASGLDTGDAGFRYAGELFVLGRLGTSLKVRGRTVFMEAVEARVCAEAGLASGRIAAVSVPESAVVLVAELDPGEWEHAALHAAASVVGPAHPVRIVTGPRGTILRTSSGKPRRRAMAASPLLADQGVYGLLERSGTRVPSDAVVLLEGSIAEGFGNAGSDVDFLIVTPGGEQTPTMPTVLFVDGRRVEVRTRSAAQLRAQAECVLTGDATEDIRNRVQRFTNARVVRSGPGAPDIHALRQVIPAREFAMQMERWWAARAGQALRYAIALDVLGERDEAVGWARDGLDQAMKSWAAARGETYLESKWLPQQLDRIGADELIDRYRTVDRTDPAALLDCAAAAGVRVGTVDVRLHRRPGITTWPIGGRLHVLRDRADVFVLSDTAARAWRGVVFGRPITDTPVADRAALATFVRLGFVGLRWGRSEPIVPALAMCDPVAPYTPVPSSGMPALSVAGARRDDVPVTFSPLPARRFAESALTLVWSNIVAENAREDLAGAVKDGQWAVAGIAAHRVVAMSVRVLLSAYGIHPLPADVTAAATVRRLLGRLDAVTDAIGAADEIRVVDAASAEAASVAVDRLLDGVRAVVSDSAFPASFASRSQWRATLDIGYDWLRLGGYLDTTLPLDEARDLLESGGAQPQEHAARQETT